jgi:hypothetical protein
MRREILTIAVVVLLVTLLGCKAPQDATVQPVKAPADAAVGAGKLANHGAVKPEEGAGKAAPTSDAVGAIKVVAYYPDNEGHAKIKAMVTSLSTKYPGKVAAEFVDFTSDEGFKRWQDDGLSCGGILINGEQTFTYEKDGKATEVTFKMAEGGEWTEADLYAVIEKLIAENKAQSKKQ